MNDIAELVAQARDLQRLELDATPKRTSAPAHMSGIDCRDIARAHGGTTGERHEPGAPPSIDAGTMTPAPSRTRTIRVRVRHAATMQEACLGRETLVPALPDTPAPELNNAKLRRASAVRSLATVEQRNRQVARALTLDGDRRPAALAAILRAMPRKATNDD